MEHLYMKEAIKEARKSLRKGEVPVGAVVVCEGKIIGRGHNLIEKKKSAIRHAEMIAIENASKKKKDWRLNGCELYVTLRPCEMCMGAISQSRISKVFYGAEKPKEADENTSRVEVLEKKEQHEIECSQMLKNFFKERRNMDK